MKQIRWTRFMIGDFVVSLPHRWLTINGVRCWTQAGGFLVAYDHEGD